MYIGGLQKFSMIDYPGKVSAIVFTAGCNFSCGYCHNPELVQPNKFPQKISEKDLLAFLNTRINKLDAVTITGGEPTIHQDLPILIKSIKDLGFLVKLDSQGTNPTMLEQLLHDGLIDYIAMDIKGPFNRYQEIVSMPVNISDIKKSVKLIMQSGLPYEFRTTIIKAQLSPEDLESSWKEIKGAQNYYLQKFLPTKTNDPSFLSKKTYSDKEFIVLKKTAEKYFDHVGIR